MNKIIAIVIGAAIGLSVCIFIFKPHITHFTIHEIREGNPELIALVDKLHTATSFDTIIIHINSPGGSVDTTLEIFNGIRNTKAKVYTINEGIAFSGGAYIALAGDLSLNKVDSCSYMLHLARSYNEKGEPVLLPIADPFQQLAIEMLRTYKLLTLEEVVRIVGGDDVFMTCKSINSRH